MGSFDQFGRRGGDGAGGGEGASGEAGVARLRTELRMGLGFGGTGRESWKRVTRTAVNFAMLSR
jgi:hypothetical protein